MNARITYLYSVGMKNMQKNRKKNPEKMYGEKEVYRQTSNKFYNNYKYCSKMIKPQCTFEKLSTI